MVSRRGEQVSLISPHCLVGGDALVEEEREHLDGGGGATPGERRAGLDVLEGDEPGRGGGRGEVAEHALEEALVAGERDGARARAAGREPVLLLRLPEQLPEHRVVQVRRPHHEPPRRAAHAHGHVARRDRRRQSACRSQTTERILLMHLAIT
jgi:hypothetical protein